MLPLDDWRHRGLVFSLAASAALVVCCSGESSKDGRAGGGAGAARDASVGGAGNAGTAGTAAGGQGGTAGGTGGVGIAGAGIGGFGGTITPGPIDANRFDGLCDDRCIFPGGQLCGRIGSNCGRGFVECPVECGDAGFFCGGSGLANICGAARDSGACKPVVCNQPGGQYCGVIGGGCGDALDCGACLPPFTCGGGGVPGVCGFPDPGDCMPAVCNPGPVTFCGAIGDGCGKGLDCGACPAGQRCVDNVCSAPCPFCTPTGPCDGGVGTTISGIAVTPSLLNPIPVSGAVVFIPGLAAGAKLPPLADGPTCSECVAPTTDMVVAFAVTGPDGRFTLRGVPSGSGIPIVVQLGSWRRQTTIDVLPCVDNALPAGTVRLPRNQREGDVPLTAVSTGSHDTIECLLRKIGIDDAEFTNPSGTGRIHLYRSNGATIDATTPDEEELKGTTRGSGGWARYNQILLPCEGTEILETPEALGNFADYANRGGRVLATHFSYAWLFHNGSLGTVGTWTAGSANPPSPLAVDVVTSFAAGADFAAWLSTVGALSRPAPPQLLITAPHADLGALTTGGGAKLWLSSFSPATSQAVSIEAPVSSPPAKSCGRIIFSDFHASVATPQSTTFPGECEPALSLSAEEKALAFMLFDLASCTGPKVAPPIVRPPPPPPVPPPPLPPQPPLPPPPDVNGTLRVFEQR
jgi:hypothetical protein